MSTIASDPKPIRPDKEPRVSPFETYAAKWGHLHPVLVGLMRESYQQCGTTPAMCEFAPLSVSIKIKPPKYFRRCWCWYNTVYFASRVMRLFPVSVNKQDGPFYHPAVDLWRPHGVGTLAHELRHAFDFQQAGYVRWGGMYVRAGAAYLGRFARRRQPYFDHATNPIEVEVTKWGYKVQGYWEIPENTRRLHRELSRVYEGAEYDALR